MASFADLSIHLNPEDFMTDDESDEEKQKEAKRRRVNYEEPKCLYTEVLNEFQPEFSSIAFVKKLKPNSNNLTKVNVYGVIKVVSDFEDRFRRSNVSDQLTDCFDRLVTIVDPTDDNGLEVRIVHSISSFTAGNILRIRGLKIKQESDCRFTFSSGSIHQIETFKYDYESGKDFYDFSESGDKPICKEIESWYSKRLFSETKLESLPAPKSTNPVYVDVICRVLSKRMVANAMVLKIFDGTTPAHKFNYEATIASINKCTTHSKVGIKLTATGKPVYPFDDSRLLIESRSSDATDDMMRKSAVIVVWGNESGMYCHHFVAVRELNLEEGKNLMLFTNVAVKTVEGSNYALLVLNSGRHKGKSARPVNKNSILGRMVSNSFKNKSLIV